MEAKIDCYLETLSEKDPDKRRAALLSVLEKEGFTPFLQSGEATEKAPRPAVNYLIFPEEKDTFPLFLAHYDAFPGSPGANDNAAALCIQIALMRELKKRGIPAGFAFTDGEESGHSGARLLATRKENPAFSAVINLDMCGYGDLITVFRKGGAINSGISAYCSKERLKAHNGKLVKFLPEGDDSAFSGRIQPVLSVAIMPKWDVQYLDALATYREGLIGKPPEFYQILGEMEVVTTMHGAFRDQVKWVEPKAMQQVFDYLLDAVTAPPEKRRSGVFGLFA